MVKTKKQKVTITVSEDDLKLISEISRRENRTPNNYYATAGIEKARQTLGDNNAE